MSERLPLQRLPAFPPTASADGEALARLVAISRRRAARALPEDSWDPPPRPGVLEPPIPVPAEDLAQKRLEEFWRTVQAERELTLDETLPERTRIGWRIAREMARLKNACAENELLIDGLPADPDPWTTPCPFNKPSGPADIISQKRYMVPLWDVVELICQDQGAGWPTPGLPLLPPPIPSEFLGPDGEVHPDYDPMTDHALRQYLKAAHRIVDHYAMEWKRDADGTATEDPRGRAGVAPLLHPILCRIAWPSRTQVVYYEHMVVEETIKHCAQGRATTAKYLEESYGLREREVRSLLAIAATELRNRSDMDIEEKRALLVARLEDFVDRSREALDLGNEMKGLKVLAVVEGLTRTEPEDANKEFLEATQRVANSRPSSGGALEPTVIDVPLVEAPVEKGT